MLFLLEPLIELLMRTKYFYAIVALFLLSFPLSAQSVITLNDAEEGRYRIEASVNGVAVKTYYTSENWFASMSSTTYLFLYQNDYIADADVRGMTTLKMPDGSTTKAASFVIKRLQIGNVIVQNLPAFVITKQTVPLLIGASAFDSFGEITQEGNRLIIGNDDVAQKPAEELDPIESLKLKAQEYLDANDYESAAEVYATLKEQGELSMINEYQYVIMLNLLERSKQTIALADEWLKDNEGKSLTMDYWVYDSKGASYARLKDNTNAISSYSKAVDAYCRLFNTSEAAIKKGNFKDKVLGTTLYNLGRAYASSSNLSKAQYYMQLAAKCEIPEAQKFCSTYKLKY